MYNVALMGGLIQDAIPGQGEDAVCSLLGDRGALIACMDGCGGSGAKHYEKAGNCKGARIASHEVGAALKTFFSESGIAQNGFADYEDGTIETALHGCIDSRLGEVLAMLTDDGGKSRLKSRLSAELPTTLALLMAEEDQNNPGVIETMAIWAGDSRVYAFLPSGLRQLSEDDVVGGVDAEENLSTDAIMSNAITAAGNYRLNIKRRFFKGPGIYLAATDGCFAYFPSPIMFEGVLLSTLNESSTPKEWMQRLSKRIGAVASDDYSLQYAAFASEEDDFNTIKRMYAERSRVYNQRYGMPLRAMLERDDREGLQQLWQEYKAEYNSIQ